MTHKSKHNLEMILNHLWIIIAEYLTCFLLWKQYSPHSVKTDGLRSWDVQMEKNMSISLKVLYPKQPFEIAIQTQTMLSAQSTVASKGP